MIIGYARVSTDGQTLDAQQSALLQARASIQRENLRSKDRPMPIGQAIDALGEGDVLLVTRLDRLARSTRDLLNVLATVSERGAGFRSLADPMIDTTSAAWQADPRCACGVGRVRAIDDPGENQRGTDASAGEGD